MKGFLVKITISISAAAIVAGCGASTDGQTADDRPPAVENTFASIDMTAFFELDLGSAFRPTPKALRLGEPRQSSEACRLGDPVSATTNKILDQVEQEFCTGQPIVFGVRYTVKEVNASASTDSKLLVNKNEDGSITVTRCYEKNDQSRAYTKLTLLEDGNGRADSLYTRIDSSSPKYPRDYRNMYTVDKKLTDPNAISISYKYANRWVYGFTGSTDVVTVINDQSGSLETTSYEREDAFEGVLSIPSTAGTKAYSQKLVRFDHEYGRALTLQASATSSEDLPEPTSASELFDTVQKTIVSADVSAKFAAGGRLDFGAADLPPKLDEDFTIELPSDIWDCQTTDEVVEIDRDDPANACYAGIITAEEGHGAECNVEAQDPDVGKITDSVDSD